MFELEQILINYSSEANHKGVQNIIIIIRK